MGLGESYTFHPLDVATYIKWSQLQGEAEYLLLQRLWKQRKALLDKRCGRRFELFAKRVYDELYGLWTRDFVNEACPIERALDARRYPARLFLEREAALERQLVLYALHLRLTERLPFLTLVPAAFCRRHGIAKPSAAFWRRVQSALRALGLELCTDGGAPYSFSDFSADAPACLRLSGD